MTDGLAVGLAVGLALVASACGSSRDTAARSSTTDAPVTSASTSAPPTSGPPTSAVTTTSPPALPTSGGPEDLPVSTSDVTAFETAFSDYSGVPVSDIAGVVSGSTHEAFVPSTGTYWATARFTPSAAADRYAADFQDGGDIGIFTRSPSSTWVMTRPGGEPFPCPGDFPTAVQALWGLTSSAYCSSPT